MAHNFSETYDGPTPMNIESFMEDSIPNSDSAITNLRLRRQISSSNRIKRHNSSSGMIPTAIEEEPEIINLNDTVPRIQHQNQEINPPLQERPPVRSFFHRRREPQGDTIPVFSPEDFPPLPSVSMGNPLMIEEPQPLPPQEAHHQHITDINMPLESQPNLFSNNSLSRGAMIIRTIHPGADGTMIVRLRVIPMMDIFGGPSQGNNEGGQNEELGIIGALMGMLAGLHGGRMFSLSDLFHDEHGLGKEDLDSLPVVTYNTEAFKNVDEESKKCPICLDCFEDGNELKYLWCLHRFHKGCVDQWLDKHTTCPICKKDYYEAQKEDKFE